MCAKGEACEFLHHLPTEIDVQGLQHAMSHVDLSAANAAGKSSEPEPSDDFPTLSHANALTSGPSTNGAGPGGANANAASAGAGAKNGGRYGPYAPPAAHDPSRTRFAAAVKKPPPPQLLQSPSQSTAATTATNTATTATPAVAVVPRDLATLAARREAMGTSGEPLHHGTAIVAPKASPRIKLRPPTLLPTLPTGESVNSLYMAYRSR